MQSSVGLRLLCVLDFSPYFEFIWGQDGPGFSFRALSSRSLGSGRQSPHLLIHHMAGLRGKDYIIVCALRRWPRIGAPRTIAVASSRLHIVVAKKNDIATRLFFALIRSGLHTGLRVSDSQPVYVMHLVEPLNWCCFHRPALAWRSVHLALDT